MVAVATNTLTGDLFNETIARGNADAAIGVTTGTLRADLTAETGGRIAADGAIGVATGTIAGSLASEITDRGNADIALGGRLDVVAVATNTLTGDLANEITARGNADNEIGIATGTLATLLAGKAGTGANTFTGVQTYGSGASITASDSPGLTISTGIFVLGITVYPESGTTVVADGATLAVDRAFMKLAGSGGRVTLNAVTGIAAGTSGQVVTLAGTSDTNTVRLTHSGNIQLKGGVPYTLAQNGVMTLVFNGVKWVELNGGR